MNFLIFSELFYPHGSGAELATWLYSNILAKQGCNVSVVTRQFPGELCFDASVAGLRVYRLPMAFMSGSRYHTLANFGVLMNHCVVDLIKQSDVVYVPCGWYSVVPVAKRYSKPVIVHLHNYSITCPTSLMYDFEEKRCKQSSLRSYFLHEKLERQRGSVSTAASSFMNEFIGKFYNKVGAFGDVLIFVSQAQMDLAVSANPSLKEKSCLIYNPIPDVPFIPAKNSGVAYFGGKHYVKGYPVLLKALCSIQPKKKVKAYLTMTSRENKETNLRNGVSLNFFPKLSKAGVDGLLLDSSVVVIPSLWPEPAPYSLIESMLHGKLIVASNIGGIPEIIGLPSTGARLIKPDDPFELANTIESLIELEPEEANELGLKNRAHVLNKFNNDKTAASFVSLIEKTVHH